VYNVSYLNHSTLQSNFTVLKGVLVDIKDTIKGFNMIIDGELDHLPESAFNLKGTIEEAD
jgi:F-type H+-transporting ATPase subunit beta